MPVVGIDPSTSTGLVCLDSDSGECVAKQVVFPTRKGFYRLQSIATSVRSLIEEWKPEKVVIEGYAYGNPHTLVILVEIGTLIRQVMYQQGVDWYTVPPTTVKKFVTGSGSAKKGDMAKSVKEKWGFVNACDDVVDAYALARIGLILGTESASHLRGIEYGC